MISVRRLCLLATLLAIASSALAVQDLTFLHLSDIHAPYMSGPAREAISALPSGPIPLTPHGVTVPAPAFAVVTGDLNEFSGGAGYWEQYLALWRGLGLPVYHQLGNHDNTWDCARPRLRRLHGSCFYAFEHGGLKLIGWDTATPQDPRPSIATEGLLWLQDELIRTPPEQPLILFCHHPLDGTEYASAYDRARLLDLLHTRNTVAVLVGHGHGVRAWQIEGLDTVMGGSTFGKTPGFGIVSIKDNVLRICHQYVSGERKVVPLLQKPLPPRSPFLQVTWMYPPDGFVFSPDEALEWRVQLGPERAAVKAAWAVDGKLSGEMAHEDDAWVARVPHTGLDPGAHTIRFVLTAASGLETSRTLCFWLDGGPMEIAWKQQLSGSCQSGPTVADGRLYVGANDGGLYAFDAASGELLWRYLTAGEVRSRPLLSDGLVIFGSADSGLYAVTAGGELKWRCDAGSPIYATPAVAGDRAICGTNSGEVVCVDRRNGELLWRSREPKYAIETAPGLDSQAGYLGSWDRYLYAFSLQDGALRWRMPSRGSDREGDVARYYSPADCGPVVCGGNVFVADRAYFLTVLGATTGKRLSAEEHCAAVSLSQDGQAVYVRHDNGKVSKRRADGSAIWTADVPTGSVQTPPTEAQGRVWVISSLGTLSELDAATGRLLCQYKAFPDVWAFSAPASDGERVYVADMAGHLLALRLAGR